MKILDNVERLAEVFDEKKIVIIDSVVIFNYNLVHPAMLDVFEHMLKVEHNHNLKAIFICPDGPLGERLGVYNNFSRSFILSLPKILGYTIETEARKQGMSLTAGVWTNMIHVFLHELHHNVAKATETEVDESSDYLECLEQDAKEYATITLEKLAADKKIEMPPLADIPWFNTHVMQLLIDEISHGEKEWAGAHKELIDKDVVFKKGNDSYTSIYEYFKDTTELATLYEKAEGVPLQMSEASKPTNVFDQEVLPGEQMDMFKQNSPPLNTVPLAPNADGSVTTITDPNGNHAQGMRERGATEEDIQRGMRNARAAGHTVKGDTPVEKEGNLTLEELELLDSADHMEEGDPARDVDVAYAEPQTSPAPAAPAPVAAPSPAVEPSTADKAMAMCMTVYARLVEHMFTVCGHRNDGSFVGATQTAITPMVLSGEEIASGLFAGSYTINLETMSTVWDDCKKAGGIRGRTFKNGSLPGYDLMINWFGKIRKIRLVAQNPTKGSAPAARARMGVKIVWLIDQDAPSGQGFIGSWENRVYTSCKR